MLRTTFGAFTVLVCAMIFTAVLIHLIPGSSIPSINLPNASYYLPIPVPHNLWITRPRLKAPLNGPPVRIYAAPYTYTVHYTSEEALDYKGVYAITYHSEVREIWLNPYSADLHEEMMHEILHIAARMGDGNGRLAKIGEESIIVSQAGSLLTILRDNPKLVEWFTQDVHKIDN